MRIILLVCLIFISCIGIAQGSLEAIQKTMELFDKGEYENTIKVAEPALPKVKLEFGESSPFYSGMIFLIAISHFKLYHYTKAEPYFVRQLELTRQSMGENNLNYIASLNGLALLYRELGKYRESEALYVKALDISARMTNTNDTAYAKSQNNLASLYQYIGQYAKAEQLYQASGEIMRKAVGENSALYATCLNNIGTLYNEMGFPAKAKPLMVKATQLRKIVLGENHSDYAGSLNNLGFTLTSLNEFSEAEKNFLLARDIFKRTLGENHTDYASSLNNLGELYRSTGEYDKAENYYLASRDIRKKTLGETHPDYALSLNNLASLYEFAGRYELAESLMEQAKEAVKKNAGEEHPYYITTLNNQAALFHSIGDYAKAEALYIQSRNLRLKLYGESHPSYAMALNNLATFYQELGQFEKAEPFYLLARDIWEKSVGEKHPDYAMCSNNLAALYEDLEKFKGAEPLYIQSKETRKAVFGEEHADYAASLNNLAGLYTKMGQYGKAEPLLLQARNIWKRTAGENNPLYATSLNNLGAFYRKSQTKYIEAEQFYLQSLALRKKLLGNTHPLTAGTENDLALLYMNMQQPQKAVPLFISSSVAIRKNLLLTFPVLSDKEKGNYINENLIFNECSNSFLYLDPKAGQAIINNNVNLQLFFKSLSLSDTRHMLETARRSKDTTLKRLMADWGTIKSLLTKQYLLPAGQRMKNLPAKEQEAEDLEKELSRRSAEFRKQQYALQVNIKDVRQNLEDDEAAIEFVSFRLFNKKTTDSIIYGAYIFKKQDSITRFIPLFEEKQLQKLIDSAGKSATGVAHQFYRGIEIRDRSSISVEKDLYKLLWLPIEPELRGIKKISYSPSGKLYGIALHALRVDSSHLLMDKYYLKQYTSTRQIAFRGQNTLDVKPGSIALFGNPDFTMDSTELSRSSNKRKELSGSISMTTRGGNNEWPDLPGTGEEVSRIANIFRSKKLTTKEYIQKNATEENLKATSENAPMALHIATHGYFLALSKKMETTSGNAYSVSKDPLFRSGLILSGGNYAWSGRRPIEGVEDGIVTASEISQMDLGKTELVVLSACETALGDIKGNEGVFGLQRAFKMAGVKKMIVSLWQVPDKETAELMTSFYSYWLSGKKIEDAFASAQAEMRKKYAPFYWAAFVLIE